MKNGSNHNVWSSRHDHVFDQDRPTTNEKRTLVVVVITAVTMVVEIAAGLVYGSMALLADGLHMASHAVALGIAAFAYRYARKHAADPRFSFGTTTGISMTTTFARPTSMYWQTPSHHCSLSALCWQRSILGRPGWIL